MSSTSSLRLETNRLLRLVVVVFHNESHQPTTKPFAVPFFSKHGGRSINRWLTVMMMMIKWRCCRRRPSQILFLLSSSVSAMKKETKKKQPYQKKFFLLYKFLVHFYCILFMLNEILKYHLIQPTYLSVCFSLDFIDNLKRRKEVGGSSATGEGGVCHSYWR